MLTFFTTIARIFLLRLARLFSGSNRLVVRWIGYLRYFKSFTRRSVLIVCLIVWCLSSWMINHSVSLLRSFFFYAVFTVCIRASTKSGKIWFLVFKRFYVFSSCGYALQMYFQSLFPVLLAKYFIHHSPGGIFISGIILNLDITQHRHDV